MLYNVVDRASLVSGQPEDISVVLANLDAIAAVLNGGIENSNVRAAAAIEYAKLALTGQIKETDFVAGKIFDPAKLKQNGATAGQALVWDSVDSQWEPGGGTSELAYGQVVTDKSTAGSWITTGSAITLDGSTKVKIEAYVPALEVGGICDAYAEVRQNFNSGGMAGIGRFSKAWQTATTSEALYSSYGAKFERITTPAAGTYIWEINLAGAGTWVARATGNFPAAWVRVTRA